MYGIKYFVEHPPKEKWENESPKVGVFPIPQNIFNETIMEY